MRMHDFGNRVYYCVHAARIDDMGKLGAGHPPKTSPKWCPKRIKEQCYMQFKDLEWKDIISDGVFVCSYCDINLCGWIKIEFRINHEPKENKYYLYSFGRGSIRRLQPEKYDSVESAKNVAYRTYSNEMARIKKAVDYLVADNSY